MIRQELALSRHVALQPLMVAFRLPQAKPALALAHYHCLVRINEIVRPCMFFWRSQVHGLPPPVVAQ